MNDGIQNNDVWTEIFGILNIWTFGKNIHRSYNKCYQLVYITQETIQMCIYGKLEDCIWYKWKIASNIKFS